MTDRSAPAGGSDQDPKIVAVLGYHKIGSPPRGTWTTWNYVPVERFRTHLRTIRDSGWDVLDVARHIVGIFRRVAAAPSGADLHDLPLVPDVATGDLDDALADVAQEVHTAWTDPATLESVIDAPWGPTPGAACLLVWSADVLVHSWDLARALDLDPEWPPGTAVLAEVMRSGLPADGRADLPFGDVVEVAADAPPIDRLVAWTGRDPATA